MEKSKTKNLFEGYLSKAQQYFISHFIAYVRTEDNSIIIEIPFPKDNWTRFEDAKHIAEHIKALRD